LVVKRALARLLVDGEWTAKPERAMTEAAAITVAHGLTPGQVPQLVDADPEQNVVVMTAAPADWVSWRSVLMGERPDPGRSIGETAAELGALLGRWHQRTWHDAALADRFDDYEAFEQLRVHPFHRAVAERHPAVSRRVLECAEELLTRRDCFVHGDYSPKNVLVGRDGLMVLDFEVAHFGAAVFDVAFMQSHLVLKALHRRGHAEELASAAAAFLRAYLGEARRAPVGGCADVLPEGLRGLGHHIGCLLLARVDGLSPAPYLHRETADTVRRLALRLLVQDDLSVSELWAAAREVAA
jgi:5-methylthioribose kinase